MVLSCNRYKPRITSRWRSSPSNEKPGEARLPGFFGLLDSPGGDFEVIGDQPWGFGGAVCEPLHLSRFLRPRECLQDAAGALCAWFSAFNAVARPGAYTQEASCPMGVRCSRGTEASVCWGGHLSVSPVGQAPPRVGRRRLWTALSNAESFPRQAGTDV